MPDRRAKEARPAIVEDTLWNWRDSDDAEESYRWHFRAGGLLAYDSESGSWENGSWSCDGATLRIETNDHYADYVGYVRPNEVRGTARNVTGYGWSWWAELE